MSTDVLVIAHFCSDFDGKGNNRFNYLADMLSKNNYYVELVTSDFSHTKKQKRNNIEHNQFKFKITYIREPIYKKNVSLKRFYSHFIMGDNLKKYLECRKIPDIIYCAVPSLDVAKVTAQFAQKHRIKLIIDIQDLWPEAFKMVFNLPIISDLMFLPMGKKADYIYKRADAIIAVSKTYCERALLVNQKQARGHVIYLGTELKNFDKLA